ncbi:hypothetical protein SAMN04487792_1659, partial [Lactobacillus bombicola]
LAAIDKIVLEKNINAPKKISRESFLREQIEKIPLEFETQKQDTEVSILIKKQNKLLKELLFALNVLAKFFIEGDEEGLKLLDSLSLVEAKEE